jgi:hypothetical protein
MLSSTRLSTPGKNVSNLADNVVGAADRGDADHLLAGMRYELHISF